MDRYSRYPSVATLLLNSSPLLYHHEDIRLGAIVAGRIRVLREDAAILVLSKSQRHALLLSALLVVPHFSRKRTARRLPSNPR